MCDPVTATIAAGALGAGATVYAADKASDSASRSQKSQDKLLAMKQQMLARRQKVVDDAVAQGLFDPRQTLARYMSDTNSAIDKASRNNAALQIAHGFSPNSERSQRSLAYLQAAMARQSSGNMEDIRQNAFRNRLNAEQALNPDFTQELSILSQRQMQSQSKADALLSSVPGMVSSLLPYLAQSQSQAASLPSSLQYAGQPLGKYMGGQEAYTNAGPLTNVGTWQSDQSGNVYWKIPRV